MWNWQTSGNGDVVVLSAVLFLRARTPARLWQDLSRGYPGRRCSATLGSCGEQLGGRFWSAVADQAAASADTAFGSAAQNTGQRLVAALVRARRAVFQPRSPVCITNPGAQWTARPTLTLRLCASTIKPEVVGGTTSAPS